MERCYGVCYIQKEDMLSVSNYRPISLLSCLERVAERAVFKHLYNHLHENSIVTPLQSSFIPGDSPTNQLTYLYDTFSHALDSGKEIRVVFCDISKVARRLRAKFWPDCAIPDTRMKFNTVVDHD